MHRNLLMISAVMLTFVGCSTLGRDESGPFKGFALSTNTVDAQYEAEYVGNKMRVPIENPKLFQVRPTTDPYFQFGTTIKDVEESIATNPELSKEDRRTMTSAISGLVYESNKYFVFKIATERRKAPEDQDFSVEVTDRNGDSVKLNTSPYLQQVVISRSAYYTINLFIQTETQLTREDGPYSFTVYYPNLQKKIYTFQPWL